MATPDYTVQPMRRWQYWLIGHVTQVGLSVALVAVIIERYIFGAPFDMLMDALVLGLGTTAMVAWNPLTSQRHLLPKWRRRLPLAIVTWVATLILGGAFLGTGWVAQEDYGRRKAYERQMLETQPSGDYLKEDWYLKKLYSFQGTAGYLFAVAFFGMMLCALAYKRMLDTPSKSAWLSNAADSLSEPSANSPPPS